MSKQPLQLFGCEVVLVILPVALLVLVILFEGALVLVILFEPVFVLPFERVLFRLVANFFL